MQIHMVIDEWRTNEDQYVSNYCHHHIHSNVKYFISLIKSTKTSVPSDYKTKSSIGQNHLLNDFVKS